MKSIQVVETKHSSGYGKSPWIFRGRALYQFHLVKAEIARGLIPKELKLVEAFGYTLGGFFLASYDDSPAGVFDELVVIAGTVWNPPTSCAWAARVLVSSDEACDHGRKDVGLPSQVAKFSKKITVIPREENSTSNTFLNMIGMGTGFRSEKGGMDIQVSEMKGPLVTDICNINFGTIVKTNEWKGPAIKMSLPSFSGRTVYNPKLLKYSCQIYCRVRALRPAKVSGPSRRNDEKEQPMECESCRDHNSVTQKFADCEQRLSISVMLSKPILALEFSNLKMQVEAPTVVSPLSENSF